MNNNTPAILRSLIIYALCVPLAVWLGFTLADPFDRSTFSYFGILALILITPILFRWHHFLLIAGWNFAMTIFFLPGTPPVWLLLTVLSLGFSMLHRTINGKARFLSAPAITWPLVFFAAVVLFTAELTGGIGLHSLGNDVSGGKHYVTVLFGILGYFALTAQRIPPQRVGLYISLFYLMGLSNCIGELAAYVPSSLNFIFAFFPANFYNLESQPGMTAFHARYAGLGLMGMSGFLFVISRYGVRGVLLSGKPWRWLLLILFFTAIFFGGFRSHVLVCSLTFALLFFMDRMHQTKLMPLFIMAGLTAAIVIIPFANKLPFTFQRSLAFLPLNLDKAARLDADASEDWRLEIWRDTYPKVPQYLLLGRGYAISQGDLAMSSNENFRYLSRADEVAISGNYHSGPLSVLMPFGAWGAIALLWLWFAGLRALHDNYRYGDPAFKSVNMFLFAYFLVKILMFLIVFGAIENDVAAFAVLLGLSVSINGGVRRSVAVAAPAKAVTASPVPRLARPRFQPSFPR